MPKASKPPRKGGTFHARTRMLLIPMPLNCAIASNHNTARGNLQGARDRRRDLTPAGLGGTFLISRLCRVHVAYLNIQIFPTQLCGRLLPMLICTRPRRGKSIFDSLLHAKPHVLRATEGNPLIRPALPAHDQGTRE
jgi:hypothetical protein